MAEQWFTQRLWTDLDQGDIDLEPEMMPPFKWLIDIIILMAVDIFNLPCK